MAKLLSEKAQSVITFLQANQGVDLTAKAIAEAVNIETKSITGVLNGLQKKGFVVREIVEGQKDKLIRLTPEGAAVDPDAEKSE